MTPTTLFAAFRPARGTASPCPPSPRGTADPFPVAFRRFWEGFLERYPSLIVGVDPEILEAAIVRLSAENCPELVTTRAKPRRPSKSVWCFPPVPELSDSKTRWIELDARCDCRGRRLRGNCSHEVARFLLKARDESEYHDPSMGDDLPF